MEFEPSRPSSIGMEMEFQLLDTESLDLTDAILPLMELYPDDPHIKPEFIQNTVEVCSKICQDVDELDAHMRSLVRELRDSCRRLDLRLCSAGTHPFGERLALITPMPRYRRLEKSAGYVGYNQITFATHVHIGMTSGGEAITIMRELKALLPLLVALSASSPFWRGFDTGYAAYRHRILAATRSYGIPPSFKSWHDFTDFFETTRRAGVFDTINDIHWDIRPRPHLGTLEVRVMDAQPSISQALTMAGFIRVLVSYLRSTSAADRPPLFPRGTHWWMEKHNHFQASQLGMKACYIHGSQGRSMPMHEIFLTVLRATADTAQALSQDGYTRSLERHAADGPSYVRQREVYARTGSLKAVVDGLVKELEQELDDLHDS